MRKRCPICKCEMSDMGEGAMADGTPVHIFLCKKKHRSVGKLFKKAGRRKNYRVRVEISLDPPDKPVILTEEEARRQGCFDSIV